MNKNIHMKEDNIIKPVAPKLSSHHTKSQKIRLLPDIFYLRWELELLSAFVLIFALTEVPFWVSSTTKGLFPESGPGINPYWISVSTTALIIGFSIYIILRLIWLILIRKQIEVSSVRLRYIRELDQIAELIISVCIIVLVIGAFAYFIHLLVTLLQNELPDKTGNPFNMNQ